MRLGVKERIHLEFSPEWVVHKTSKTRTFMLYGRCYYVRPRDRIIGFLLALYATWKALKR